MTNSQSSLFSETSSHMKFSVLRNLKIVMRILLFSASSDFFFLSPQGDSGSFTESNRISAAVVGNLERKIYQS